MSPHGNKHEHHHLIRRQDRDHLQSIASGTPFNFLKIACSRANDKEGRGGDLEWRRLQPSEPWPGTFPVRCIGRIFFLVLLFLKPLVGSDLFQLRLSLTSFCTSPNMIPFRLAVMWSDWLLPPFLRCKIELYFKVLFELERIKGYEGDFGFS